MKELQEMVKSLKADKELMAQDKKYMEESLKKSQEKAKDMEYELRKK